MKYKRRSTGEIVDAVQWEPGLEHPAVVREYPADRGHPGGHATTKLGDHLIPDEWLVSYLDAPALAKVWGPSPFNSHFEFAEEENPPLVRTCWLSRIAGVVDSPCGEDCAAWVGGCGLLAAVGMPVEMEARDG